MNIYIYGNQSFKKEIHETLEHSNIRFKLDDNTDIKDIVSIDELKEAIKNNPKDIYLIDDEKIIKKKSFKFLKPKDGIEEEFLLDSGIADLSIDSLKEIPKYIIKKYEELKSSEPQIIERDFSKNSAPIEQIEQEVELDEELAMLLTKEKPEEKKIETKTSKISSNDSLDDLFNDMSSGVNLHELENLISDEPKAKSNEDFNDNFGLNNISFDYDDDDILNDKGLSDEDMLSNLLEENIEDEESSEHIEEVFDDVDFLDEIFGKKDEEKKVENNFHIEDFENEDLLPIKDEDVENIDFLKELDNKDENIESTDDFDFLDEIEKLEKNDTQASKGEKMSNDEFFELDSLNEKDLLEALNFADTNSIVYEKVESKPAVVASNATNNVETLSIDSSNINDLSLLISRLLNNKTLEITIKIKD